ncbi:hypothetical protein L6452_43896 [Arctium lappa]|uniref:Uncharacterized protein n=1 Tax=Arctium lappa TaxID=4217 RepID=A0ACB8XDM8_ARCLA|nr:hypothetical protein L6452_43896 [Arctium lappa]
MVPRSLSKDSSPWQFSDYPGLELPAPANLPLGQGSSELVMWPPEEEGVVATTFPVTISNLWHRSCGSPSSPFHCSTISMPLVWKPLLRPWHRSYLYCKMEEQRSTGVMERFLGGLINKTRTLLFRCISCGPIPQHIAFIMDGNRRFAKKWQLEEGAGHKAGFLALISVLKYCYEMGVKYVTVYAFSIDNFNRRPDEVQYVMDLMREKIEAFLKEIDIVNKYGVRVLFIGNLDRLYEPVRIAAKQAMEATAHNTNTYLLICVAYASSYEIQRAVTYACQEKSGGVPELGVNGNGNMSRIGDQAIKVVDLEKHMYMGVVPNPDILVRSSGETRLSDFLLWQTTNCVLYSPKALWPEMGLRQIIWGILKYQRNYYYLEKQKKLD